MIIAIPKETQPSEKRVAIAPDNVAAFAKLGYEVLIEKGAGEAANLADSAYEDAGARIAADAAEGAPQRAEEPGGGHVQVVAVVTVCAGATPVGEVEL